MGFLEFLKKNKQDEDAATNDKVFMRSILMSFFAIIICIVALSASSFAWFNTSVQSSETIQTSVYKLAISVDSTDPNAPALSESRNGEGNLTYDLAANLEYSFTVTAVADETTTGSTGYIKLRINGETHTFISEQIDRGETISFTLSFIADTTVELIECWGISILPEEDRDIINGSSFSDMH